MVGPGLDIGRELVFEDELGNNGIMQEPHPEEVFEEDLQSLSVPRVQDVDVVVDVFPQQPTLVVIEPLRGRH